MVNIMPAMNVGTTSASTSGSTGSLSDPDVSTLPSSSSTLAGLSSSRPTDLSNIQVTIFADNLITRSLFSKGLKVFQDALESM